MLSTAFETSYTCRNRYQLNKCLVPVTAVHLRSRYSLYIELPPIYYEYFIVLQIRDLSLMIKATVLPVVLYHRQSNSDL